MMSIVKPAWTDNWKRETEDVTAGSRRARMGRAGGAMASSRRRRKEPGTRTTRRRRKGMRRMRRIGMRKGRRYGKGHTLYRCIITITITHLLGTQRGREVMGHDNALKAEKVPRTPRMCATSRKPPRG
jgi:hypothetical protein